MTRRLVVKACGSALLSTCLLLWVARGTSGMASEGTVVLDTPSGKIRGERYVLADGSRGMRFLGIPYARPPVGALRFAAPEEASPWDGVLDARRFGPMCYQPLENEVWDTVESNVDLGHLEDQLRKALAQELGELHEEDEEEIEDEARKAAEEAQRRRKLRKEEECKGAEVDGGRPECHEWNLDDTVPVSDEAEVFRTSGPGATTHTSSDTSSNSSDSTHSSVELSSDETHYKNSGELLFRRLRNVNSASPNADLPQTPEPGVDGAAGSLPLSLQKTSEGVKERNLTDKRETLIRPKGIYNKKASAEDVKKPDMESLNKNSEREGEPANDSEYLYMKQKRVGEYNMSEDCLTLNVYTPLIEGAGSAGRGTRRRGANATMPVLLYIHGGSFYSNGGRLYPGEKLASEGIVVVTINYRLGPFGFLSTGDSTSRGNWGLLDQRLAMLWVRRHAQYFGAHKDKLLLVGNSAGAASVILHLVSPLSQGLFTRAVALSGCALAPWSLQTRPNHFAQKLAADVGCPQTPSTELVDCLRRTDPHTINEVYEKDNLQDGLWLTFAPVVEGDLPGVFLPRAPRRLLEEGSLPPVPLIMTLTRDEVSIWFRKNESFPPENIDLSLGDAEKWMDMLMKLNFPELEPLALAAVRHAVRASYLYRNGYHHTPAAPQPMVPIKVMAELISDLGLRVPCVEEAGLLSRWTSLYFAEFSYASPDDVRVGDQKWIGSYHESELQFVFGQPFLGLMNTLRGPDDRSVATTIMRLIISFAHTGVPELRGLQWPTYNMSHLVHLEMSEHLSLSHNLVQHRLCFWQRFIPLMTAWPMKPPNDEKGAAAPLATPSLALLPLLHLLHQALT
ncbi:carboxylesterase 1E-like isoform X2 [Homarus americanus]|uniref:carboxylesterase 1E-like isoform X2 n=1 Tax=Homarus americanus TaxID=6706 RepID=UPI001C44D27B|nr:carboxylesterase 1E-like isoform X2 [Homarus americanus]